MEGPKFELEGAILQLFGAFFCAEVLVAGGYENVLSVELYSVGMCEKPFGFFGGGGGGASVIFILYRLHLLHLPVATLLGSR